MSQNCIILGSGRSGTSMLAEILHRSGYYLGGLMMNPSDGNPHGYFESREVEALNEDILCASVPQRPMNVFGRFLKHRPVRQANWLAVVRKPLPSAAGSDYAERLQSLMREEPWCFKDPRFSYTLPCLWPALETAAMLVVFRAPQDTALSMAKEYQNRNWYRFIQASHPHFLAVWEAMYRQILEHHSRKGQWYFFHYDQILDGSARQRLETALGQALDWSGVDPQLKRSVANGQTPRRLQSLYLSLCQRAGYSPS